MQLQSGLTASLVASCYEGITTPHRYAEGLQQMAELLGCNHASLSIWDGAGSWGRIHRAVRKKNCWQLGVEENVQPAVNMRALVARMKPGEWQIHEHRLALAASEHGLIVDCGAAQQLDSALCIRLLSTHGTEVFLSLQKNRLSWKMAGKALQLAEEMARPLLHAVGIQIQMRLLSQQATLRATVLDCIRMPLLMLDSGMRVLVANTFAKSLIEKKSSASPHPEKISLDGVSGERLASLVRRACGQSGPAAAGSLPLSVSNDEHGQQIIVLPIAADPAEAKSACALVLICGQQPHQDSASQLLQHIYALTPAEARLAMLILHGQAPNSAAAQLQVSVTTVRSQLSSILKKTGALRQSDLVRRLSSILLINQRVARSPS